MSECEIAMAELLQNIPPKKLPVLATFREAVVFAWAHRRVLWRWIVVGAFLAGLVNFVGLFEFGEDDADLTGLQFFAIILLVPIPSLLVFALLAVYCHRSFLLYHGSASRQLRFFFIERDRKFFAWVIGIPLCVCIVIFPGMMAVAYIWYQIGEMYPGGFWESIFVADLLINVWLLFPFYYLFGRWILVFPAIAIDEEPKLGWSWNQTKGNGWRMFVLVGLLPLTVGNLWYLLSFIGLSEFPILSGFLTSFVLFSLTPVEVAVISIAFRELTNWTPHFSASSESTLIVYCRFLKKYGYSTRACGYDRR